MKILSNKKWGEVQGEILALKKERQQLRAQVATKTNEITAAKDREQEDLREERAMRLTAENKVIDLEAKIAAMEVSADGETVREAVTSAKIEVKPIKTPKKNATSKKKA